MKKWLFLIAICVILLSCKEKPSALDLNIYRHLVRYGDLPLNEMVIYAKNEAPPSPLLLFVHGGEWSNGSYDFFLKPHIINWATKNGYVFSAINYSLSPNPIELDNPMRIKHPAHIQDLAKSVRWIYDNAQKYGVDRNRIFLIGHSAGAQMVCLLGTNGKYLQQVGLDLNNIGGIISLDGGAYLTNEASLMFPADNDKSVEYKRIVIKRIYYNAFTFDPLIYNDACPYLHIERGKSIPPFLYIYQAKEEYRYRPNEQMYNKMIENGIDASLYVDSFNDHNQIFYQVGAYSANSKITERIENFISSH